MSLAEGEKTEGRGKRQLTFAEEDAPPAPVSAFERGPVLLVLDAALQQLPWESLPCLREQRFVPTSLYPAQLLLCATHEWLGLY